MSERRFNNLRELREYKGLSLKDVGDALGVTPPTIWQWEQRPNDWFKPRQRLQLLSVFTEAELSEALDPDWKKPEVPDEPAVDEAPAPVRKSAPPFFTARTNAEIEHMLRELLTVFVDLDDVSRVDLVDYADYLYHRKSGMVLPRITKYTEDIPEDTWDNLDKLTRS